MSLGELMDDPNCDLCSFQKITKKCSWCGREPEDTKMSETFKEWFFANPELKEFLPEVQIGEAWNHQQKKIDEKDVRIAALEKKVTELSWDGALNEAEQKIKELERQNKQLAECAVGYDEAVFPDEYRRRVFKYHPLITEYAETITLAKQILERKE